LLQCICTEKKIDMKKISVKLSEHGANHSNLMNLLRKNPFLICNAITPSEITPIRSIIFICEIFYFRRFIHSDYNINMCDTYFLEIQDFSKWALLHWAL